MIVQGTAVAAPAVPVASPTSNEASYGGGGATQISQEPSNKKTGCNDPIFALLFYGNIAAIVVVFIMYGKQAMSGDAADEYSTYVRFGFTLTMWPTVWHLLLRLSMMNLA